MRISLVWEISKLTLFPVVNNTWADELQGANCRWKYLICTLSLKFRFIYFVAWLGRPLWEWPMGQL